jgi:acylphosphatase
MKLSLFTSCVVLVLASSTWAAEDFTGTKEVRLVHGDLGSPRAKTVVITDKAKVAKLVAAIKLDKKEPCACDHIDHAVFVKEKGEITVSLCDHCLDIGKNTYRMPPEFYKLYTVYSQEGPAKLAESPQSVDENKAATAEVVVRGKLERDAAGPGRGGWPTYTVTVSKVFKTPKDVKIEVGQKLTVKTIKEIKGAATLYLVFDKDQKLYRLQYPNGERGFSHVEEPKATGPAGKTEAQRREVFFSGRVQGVGFRFTTQTLARGFAVTGFVKNLEDGRVQLVVEGQPKEIDKFLAAIRKERAENVEKVDEKSMPATGEFKEFEIRR